MTEYSGVPPSPKDQHCIEDARRQFVMVYLDHLDKWSVKGNGLKPSALSVYLCLLRHAGFQSRQCFPSLDTIAEMTCQSRTTVVSGIKALVKNGLVAVRKEQVPGGYERSIYTILDVAHSGQSNNWTEGDKFYEAGSKKESKPSTKSGLEQEPIERDASGAQTKSADDLPENGPAQKIVKAYCRAMNLPRPVNYGKSVKHAQLLADAGITPDEVPQIVTWLQNDTYWGSRGIDLSTVMNTAEKWRGTQNQTGGSRRRADSKGGQVYG